MAPMRIVVGAGLAVVALLALPAVVAAHGTAAPPPSDPLSLLGMWSFDPTVQVPLIAAGVAWVSAVRAVNRAHPAHPVPVRRSVAFLGGLLMLELALQSPIERYDTTLFSVHMVQHILLTLIAAPLLVARRPDHAPPALRPARCRGGAGSCRCSTAACCG